MVKILIGLVFIVVGDGCGYCYDVGYWKNSFVTEKITE